MRGAVCAIRGDLSEAEAWQGRADSLLAPLSEDALRGRLLVARSLTAFLRSRKYGTGAPHEALRTLEEARSLLGQDARLACVRGEMLSRSNDAEHVQPGYMAQLGFLNAARAAGDSLRVALFSDRLGRLEGQTGGHRSAAAHFERSARIRLAHGDSAGAALALRNQGVALWKIEAYESAEDRMERAAVVAEALGRPGLEALALDGLCLLQAERGALAAAIESDGKAHESLSRFVALLASGEAVDDVSFDLFHLVRMRCSTKLTYAIDRFEGFYDQLAVNGVVP